MSDLEMEENHLGSEHSSAPSSHRVNAKVTVDERQRTMEGFRSIGLIAIFMAALQAQMLAITLSNNLTLSAKFVNAFWIAGISLDVFGAVIATLTARWFEVLHPSQVDFLNKTWVANKSDISSIPPERSKRHMGGLIEYCVATALFSGLGVLAVGVSMFFVGLVVYIWAEQPLLVSIIGTIPVALLAPLVCCLFISHADRKQNIIEMLARKKGDW